MVEIITVIAKATVLIHLKMATKTEMFGVEKMEEAEKEESEKEKEKELMAQKDLRGDFLKRTNGESDIWPEKTRN